MRAPMLEWAAAMLAATDASTPAAKASRAIGRTRWLRRLSSTMTTLATTSMPSTLNGSAYATSGRSPKFNATWTMCEYDDHAAIAVTAPAETLRTALVPPAIVDLPAVQPCETWCLAVVGGAGLS